MKKFMSSILVLTLVLSLFAGFAVTANAAETGNVAKIGDVEYATLADAVNDAKDGDTITLLCSIELTASQYVEKEVTIDLGGYTLSATGCRALVANTASGYLTIQNGTVSSNASGTVTANYNSTVVLGENVTVISTGNFGVYVNRGTLKVSEPSAKAYGKARGVSAKTNDDKPEYFYISAGTYSAAISAEWIEEGFYGVWAKDEAGNTVYVIEASVHVVDQAGNVGRFGKLADAIAAAETGDTIILQKDVSVNAEDMVDLDDYHTFFKVEGKSITVDLNGKTVYADASAVTDKFVVGVFSTTNGGHLTLTGEGTVQGYSGATQEAAYLDPAKGNKDYNYKFYSLLAVYDDECSITVKGGNYVLDYAGDSMAYTSTNEGIVVNDGTFSLGNLGGIRNGMPWVFNARGQNIRHVVVNGGTFCADIQHQYYPFEVSVDKELALKSENGMYTVVPAVAYVNEQEWSSNWYTNEIGYATLEEAVAACEGVKTKVVGKKTYVSDQEKVTILVTVEADDADTMVEALETGKNVVLTDDVNINPAGMSNAYGTTGINVKYGQTVDGGGNVLDIQGAGGTWDSGINTTGGTIKNITVTGSFRGIFINHNSDYSGKVILENVTTDGTVYTISCDQGNGKGLLATKCTFKGWTSYAATLGDARFVECYFGEGSGYAFCRPYAPTEFVGCDFEEGFKMDARAKVTFKDCTIGGVALTAENLDTLVISNTANATVK